MEGSLFQTPGCYIIGNPRQRRCTAEPKHSPSYTMSSCSVGSISMHALVKKNQKSGVSTVSSYTITALDMNIVVA